MANFERILKSKPVLENIEKKVGIYIWFWSPKKHFKAKKRKTAHYLKFSIIITVKTVHGDSLYYNIT